MALQALVSGGAGFIGSHLVDALIARRCAVRVLDSLEPQVHGLLRDERRWPAYANPQAEYTRGDVRDGATWQDALRGVDVVFHQAAAVGVGQSMYEIERYIDANVRGTALLLDVLAQGKHNVRKLVVASSMSIYGEGSYVCPEHGEVYPRQRRAEHLARHQWEMTCPQCDAEVQPAPTGEEKPLFPTSIYATSKRTQEEMCLCVGRAYHISTVALRYFNVYGPRQALSNPYTGIAAIFSARLLNGNPPLIFEDGRQSRDFVHVSDIVQANLLAMDSTSIDADYFNIGTGRPLTVVDVATTLSTALDVDIAPAIPGSYREGDIRHCYAGIDKARRLLGYAPRVAFEEGMRELVAWVRAEQAEDRIDAATAELRRRGLVQ